MIEDLLRTELRRMPGADAPPSLGRVVRGRARRRRRAQLLVASLGIVGAAAGAVSVAAAFGTDRSTPDVLGAEPSASTAGDDCAAGPFTLVLNGRPATTWAPFTDVAGEPLGEQAGASPQTTAAQRWTLHRETGNSLQVTVPASSASRLRLIQLTLTGDPSGGDGRGVGPAAQAPADATHTRSEAAPDLTLASGIPAPDGNYGLDVMVSLLNCSTGAIHVIQPVTVTG